MKLLFKARLIPNNPPVTKKYKNNSHLVVTLVYVDSLGVGNQLLGYPLRFPTEC